MRGGARQGSALVATFLAALALAACGGSGGGDSSSAGNPASAGSKTETTGSNATPGPSGSGSESSSTSTASSAGSGSAAAANPGKAASAASAAGAPAAKARRKARAARHRLEAKAGAAAPFLVGQGDNSIPTYGSEASGSQLSEATTSLRSYLQARAAGDWTTTCSFMANPVRNQVEALAGGSGAESKGCPDAYAKLSERVPASQRVSPLSDGLAALRVEGEKAFALFYGPDEQQYMMPMVSEGGSWKVNQIEAVPWPLGAPANSP